MIRRHGAEDCGLLDLSAQSEKSSYVTWTCEYSKYKHAHQVQEGRGWARAQSKVR